MMADEREKHNLIWENTWRVPDSELGDREFKCPTRPLKKAYWGEYLAIPLPFVRLMLTKPESTDEILAFCLCEAAANLASSQEEVLTQVIYEFAEHDRGGKSELPQKIIDYIKDLEKEGKFYWSEGYGRDSRGKFNPKEELTQLSSYMHIRSPIFYLASEWFGVRRTFDVFGLKNPDYQEIKKLHEKWLEYDIDWKIFCWCKIEKVRRFHNLAMAGELNELQKVVFCAYLGMKSILGSKQYAVATEEMIRARMIGVARPADIKKEILERPERAKAAEIYKKYSARRQFAKVREKLVEWRFFKCCFGAKKRGLYFSTELSVRQVEAKVLDKELYKQKMKKAAQEFRDELKKIKT